MERRFVKVEKGLGPQGRIAVVRFDRGDNINALSQEAMRELRDVPRDFEDDLLTSVVILTGSAKAFSAGFDLKDTEGRQRDQLSVGERIHRQRLGPKMCKAWHEMDQVTIAAIEGHCIGGGAALVVSLDFRTCGKSAHFRIPEVELGMNMSWGSIPRLLALMGPARTKQAVILASDRISAAEALAWGLVETVVEDGEALPAAMAFALSSAIAWAVSAITGILAVAGSALIRRVASQPSMIGRLRSIRIRSGRVELTSSTPSWPFTAITTS